MIKVEHLRKEYPGATPLEDVNCEIRQGDVIAVIGPSGTGKSTFLRCLNQLEKPTSGRIELDGECITAPGYPIEKARRRMGMVFQNFNLFANLTAVENIMAGPVSLKGVSQQDAYDEALRLLDTVGLRGRALAYPDELSGGQKQRVAIVRAVAMKPEILLLDEPTSALDPTMVHEVLNVIRDLAAQGMTMVIVTHEMNFARQVAGRVFYMDEGGIYEEGTPAEIFGSPKKEKTRLFIRNLKALHLDLKPGGTDLEQAVRRVSDFCRQNAVGGFLVRKVQLVLGECILHDLYSRAGAIALTLEYSEKEDSLTLAAEYPGENYDPFEEGSEPEKKLLQSVCSGQEHMFEGKNQLKLFLSDRE